MESDKFLTTEEFLAIFENCYEWPETKLKGLISQYNFTRPQALYYSVQRHFNEAVRLRKIQGTNERK